MPNLLNWERKVLLKKQLKNEGPPIGFWQGLGNYHELIWLQYEDKTYVFGLHSLFFDVGAVVVGVNRFRINKAFVVKYRGGSKNPILLPLRFSGGIF